MAANSPGPGDPEWEARYQEHLKEQAEREHARREENGSAKNNGRLEPDKALLGDFIDAVFKHIAKTQRGFISLRSFVDDGSKKVLSILPVPMTGGLEFVKEQAFYEARKAAWAPQPGVFCPPVCLFSNNKNAREQDVLAGPVLSIDCDSDPGKGRAAVEEVLGHPTVLARSGGTWVDESGHDHPKWHMHFRVAKPVVGKEQLAQLKLARELVARVAGGDPACAPVSHCFRWPGSWHRKGEPKLCEIEEITDNEIVLADAIRALTAAAPPPPVRAPRPVRPDGIRLGWGWDCGGMTEQLHELIKEGCDVGERSQRFFGAVAQLDRLGWSIEGMLVLMGELFPDGIGVKYKDRLKGEIERVLGKLKPEGVQLRDFVVLSNQANAYIYLPTRQIWPAATVDAQVRSTCLIGGDGELICDNAGKPVKEQAAHWLSRHRPVLNQTWAPGEPALIFNKFMERDGWERRENIAVINTYKAPPVMSGDPRKAGVWLDLLAFVYPNDWPHLVKWFAHRVQQPGEKINHSIVLGGAPGIGKDTLLQPVFEAVGTWNVASVKPDDLFEPFNPWVKSVIVRINETHDLGDANRFQFYERSKIYIAAPPHGLKVNDKFDKHYYVPNVVGLILTTNYKTNGIYLPRDDRRHYVAWSDRRKEEKTKEYWDEVWAWYANGGYGHVAAYLQGLDLSGFNPFAPPPLTEAFQEIACANDAPEDAQVADCLDRMSATMEARAGAPLLWPPVMTLEWMREVANLEFAEWLGDPRNRRQIAHRFEAAGYVRVRNPYADSGLWVIQERRQAIYGRRELSVKAQLEYAAKLIKWFNKPGGAAPRSPPRWWE